MAKKLTMPALCFVILLSIQGCGDSNINLVKNGNFPRYPNATIGKILDGSFSSTKWSSQETSKGEIRVMFEGSITRNMHNVLKQNALQFIHADVSRGVNDIDPLTLHGRAAGVLSMIIGEDKIGKNFMGDYRQDCIKKLTPAFYGNADMVQEEVNRKLSDSRMFLRMDIGNIENRIEQARSQNNATEVSKLESAKAALLEKQANYEKYLASQVELTRSVGTPPWLALQNECAETLSKAIDEAFDELYWKEGDTVFFEWVIHSDGKSFELARFGAATMPSGLSLDRALKAIYSVE